jgi:hypothetical protein
MAVKVARTLGEIDTSVEINASGYYSFSLPGAGHAASFFHI